MLSTPSKAFWQDFVPAHQGLVSATAAAEPDCLSDTKWALSQVECKT